MRPKGRLKSKKNGADGRNKTGGSSSRLPGYPPGISDTQVPGCTRTALYPDMFDEAYPPDTSNGTRYHTFVESTSLGPVSVPGYRVPLVVLYIFMLPAQPVGGEAVIICL